MTAHGVKLSVIVPVYNIPEMLLRECLYSLVNQDGESLEFIVLNDGSSDITCELVIKEFAARDSRLHYIYKKNTGVSNTRNVGLSYASGKYIMFVDGDDQLKGGACQYAINLMDGTDYDCAILGFENSNIQEEIKPVNHVVEGKALTEFLIQITGANTRCYRDFGINVDSPWAKIFRKTIIDKEQILFPERLSRCEDAMFCLLYYEHSKKILFDSRVVYIYVTNEDSLCRRCSDLSLRMIPLVFKEFQKYSNLFHPNDERFKLACVRIIFYLLIESENVYFFNPNNHKSQRAILKEYRNILNSFPINEYRHTSNFKSLFPHLRLYRFLCWRSDFFIPILILIRLRNRLRSMMK